MAKRERQISFEKVNGWGGKRRGSGRPNLTKTVNHMKRPRVDLSKPLHITMRLKTRLPSLRNPQLLQEFKKSIKGAKVFGLFVVHFALENNHIHMIVEARSPKALANGMRSLGGRFGRIIRKASTTSSTNTAVLSPSAASARGAVFAGRYHVNVLSTPTQTRNALRYVLLNHAQHLKFIDHVDYFSSGAYFDKWKELLGHRHGVMVLEQIERLIIKNKGRLAESSLSPPQSWLCKVGWLRAPA